MKKLALMILGLAVAVIVAAVTIPMFINPNNFRDAITSQLERNTGYIVKIEGDLSIRILPLGRIRAEKVTVKSSSSSEVFAQVNILDVGVKMLPLLSGDIEVTSLALKRPLLTLSQYARGNNWQPRLDISRSRQVVNQESETQGKSSPRSIILRNVSISEGEVRYKDVQKNKTINLTHVNVESHMGSINSPIKSKLTAEWNKKPLKAEIFVESAKILEGKQAVPIQAAIESELLTLKLDGKADLMQFTGKLDAATPSVTSMSSWLSGAQEAAGDPLSANVKGDFQCSQSLCGVANSTITLGDQTFTGSAKVEMRPEKPLVTADLATETLDLTKYMQKKKAGISWIAPAYAAEAPWSNKPIDLSFLSALDGSFSIKIAKLIADKFTADNLLIRARIDRGSMSADGASTSFYQGKGNFTMNLASDGRADMLLMLESVQLEPLLKAKDIDWFSGRGNTRMALKTQGKSQEQMVANLSGEGNLHVFDGSIRGVDIAGMLRNAKSAFTATSGESQSTDFSEASGNFTITNGIISNDNLSIKAPVFRVGGKGTVNLPAYSINYVLTPQIVETLKGQGGKNKEGLGVPIRITGSLSHPNYAPDLSGVVEEAIKDPEKFKETLKDNKKAVKDLLKDGKSLFKGL